MKSNFLFSSTSSILRIDYALLILRFAVAGSMVYAHGFGKFQKIITGEEIQFVDPFGLGPVVTFSMVMFAEFICASLIALGLFTRIALVPLIINMAYIVFVHHGADGFGSQELPFIYLAVFVALFLTGPGKHSFDRLIKRVKSTV